MTNVGFCPNSLAGVGVVALASDSHRELLSLAPVCMETGFSRTHWRPVGCTKIIFPSEKQRDVAVCVLKNSSPKTCHSFFHDTSDLLTWFCCQENRSKLCQHTQEQQNCHQHNCFSICQLNSEIWRLTGVRHRRIGHQCKKL